MLKRRVRKRERERKSTKIQIIKSRAFSDTKRFERGFPVIIYEKVISPSVDESITGLRYLTLIPEEFS